MKAILGTVPVATPVNGLWTRIDIPALAFVHALYLTNTRLDVNINVTMKVNGLKVVQPLLMGETFPLAPDSALDLPNVYFLHRSAAIIVIEFQADQKGAEASFVYFESARPIPL